MKTGPGSTSIALDYVLGDYLPPLQLLASIDHTATNPEDVLTLEEVLVNNAALVSTVENTDISTKEYGTFTSKTGYGKKKCTKTTTRRKRMLDP